MHFKLVVLVLMFVVKHSIASTEESTCKFCWGPLKNVQCSAPTFDDDRKCKNKTETLALFDELLLEENLKKIDPKKKLNYKNWIKNQKWILTNKFEYNPSSTCLTRKMETNLGLASREVRSNIDKIKE